MRNGKSAGTYWPCSAYTMLTALALAGSMILVVYSTGINSIW